MQAEEQERINVFIEVWRHDQGGTYESAGDGNLVHVTLVSGARVARFDDPTVTTAMGSMLNLIYLMDSEFNIAFRIQDTNEIRCYSRGKLISPDEFEPKGFNEFWEDFKTTCAWCTRGEILAAIKNDGTDGEATLRDVWFLWNKARDRK